MSTSAQPAGQCERLPSSLVRVCGVLSYDESLLDVCINYALLVATLSVLASLNHHRMYPSYARFVSASTALLLAFQIALCLLVQCVGISIVWSAVTGMCWRLHKQGDATPPAVQLAVVGVYVLALAAWTYYAVVEEPLTSLAHALALLLGGLMSQAYVMCVTLRTSHAYSHIQH